MLFEFNLVILCVSAVVSFTLPNVDISSEVDVKQSANFKSIVNSRVTTTNFSLSIVSLHIGFSILILGLILLSYKRTSHAILRLSEDVARLKLRVLNNVKDPIKLQRK